MAFMQQLMTAAMDNPILVFGSLAAGYLIGSQMQKRKMRKQGMGGMGMGM